MNPFDPNNINLAQDKIDRRDFKRDQVQPWVLATTCAGVVIIGMLLILWARIPVPEKVVQPELVGFRNCTLPLPPPPPPRFYKCWLGGKPRYCSIRIKNQETSPSLKYSN